MLVAGKQPRRLTTKPTGNSELLKIKKKGVVWLLWALLLVGLYSTYHHYEKRKARLQREEEQRQLVKQREHQAVLDEQSRKKLDSYRERLEAVDLGRSGKLVVKLMFDQAGSAKNAVQTLTVPFVLELDQELVLPVIRFNGNSASIEAHAEIDSPGAEPRLDVRGGPAGLDAAEWTTLGNSASYRDWAQLRFSLKPSSHAWNETIGFKAPENMRPRRGYRIRLFLLAPSGETTVVAPDRNGVYAIKPVFSGLWRYLWFYFNPGQPAENLEGEQGMFFVELPSGREQLAAAARQFYHRLSRIRDENNEYQLNRLVRALAAYGRLGTRQASWVDEQLKLIRSRDPQQAKKAAKQ